MKKRHGQLVFSPTDLINFMDSPFASWMDRFFLEHPDELSPDQVAASAELLQRKGNEHESNYLTMLKECGRDIIEIPEHVDDAYEQTIEAMRAGRSIIYQGVLELDNFAGRSDFLQRVDASGIARAPSAMPLYEVLDTKLARKTKPYFIIQLCCYAEMLEKIQGVLPQEVAVVLGDASIRRYRTDDYVYFYRQLKRNFLEFQGSFDRDRPPSQLEVPDHSRWVSHSKRMLEASDDLSRVANIRKAQIIRLQKAGISTMTALAQTQLPHVEKLEPETFDALKHQARLQVESSNAERPHYDLLPPRADFPRRGLAMLPPPSVNDVWFDMEGYPHHQIEGGLEYLFGATYLDAAGAPQFEDWWAHDRKQEKIAFEQFMDWVFERWLSDKTMHIYHYANYEVAAMRRLMGRHATREDRLDHLLRNNVFVDLYQVVRQALRVGEPNYSIKNIEHLYMGKREGGVTSAVDSLVFYERWLELKDGRHWHESKILKEIRDYNRQDCDSTMLLTQWLRSVKDEAGIDYVERQPPNKDPVEREETRAEILAAKLLAEIPQDVSADPERWRIHELLAHLLEFHRREAKPVYWIMYERQDMSDQQLMDDIDCLGGLRRAKIWGEPRPGGKMLLYQFSFDAAQPTKLHEGKDCLLSHDLTGVKIDNIDFQQGLITLRISDKKEAPPDRVNLIPEERTHAKSLEEALLQVVERYDQCGELPQALHDFLRRADPRITNKPRGSNLVSHVEDLTPQVIDLIENLDESTLCIQGPPGTGKTRLASHVIVQLLKDGYKVAITSNAHKAIEHVMDKVGEHALTENVAFAGAKIGTDSSNLKPDFKNPSIVFRKKEQVFPGKFREYQLIGATAFGLCTEEIAGYFDYLFVDEAGQVSIANLVSMSRCAKNVILLGDQMQLEQPVQGSHPGESGTSTLEYFLEDNATVPETKGVFLETTWRMHPDICSLISGAVYEGKLHAVQSTADRRLILPAGGMQLISKEAGVLYVPVHHEGNSQSSDEEAETIAKIVKELLSCHYLPARGAAAQPLTLEDMLIVAPYNMQVRTIARLIPKARVASVDKFQGQEAPVVIFSMSASEGNSSPRGMEFLFSRNRLNVALSRAQTLAVMVASPTLLRTNCSNVEQMNLLNFFCRIVSDGSIDSPQSSDLDTKLNPAINTDHKLDLNIALNMVNPK